MISRKSSETGCAFTERVNEYVPASWKLWALVFKSIAAGHYDDMHSELEAVDVELVDDVSFNSSIYQLYQESCLDATIGLPSKFRYLYWEERDEILFAIKLVAEDILESYNEAKSRFPADCPELDYFNEVIKNCELIIKLCRQDWEEDEQAHYATSAYFNTDHLKSLYELVNGICIEDIDFKTFYHVLNCDGEYHYTRYDKVETIEYDGEVYHIPDGDWEEVWEDYSDNKIIPISGFGMAMYALELILISNRHSYNEEPSIYNSEVVYPETWEQQFQSRIDWRKNDFDLEENSWKTAYIVDDPEPPTYDIEQKSSDWLSMLCGRRVFRGVFTSDNFEEIIAQQDSFPIGFEQYQFIHEHADRLNELYGLLVKETEFLYTNIQRITDCFDNKYQAESMQGHASWRSIEKQKNNTRIHFIYSSLDSIHPETVQRILFERSGFAYDNLMNLPIIYSELVEEYIKCCIVQDERLKVEIRRAIVDSSMRETESKLASERGEHDDARYNAIRRLQKANIIDKDCNVLPKKEGGKYFKTTELTNFLVQNELVIPKDGWIGLLSMMKTLKVDGDKKTPSGHIREEYYRYDLHKDLGWCSKQLNWSAFIDVFYLQGEKLGAASLHHYFTSNNDERERIITYMLKKYDKPMGETAHATIRKNKIDDD